MVTRRQLLLGSATALTTVGLAGCNGGTDTASDDLTATSVVDADAEVLVGPQNRLEFDPDSLTVSTGETVAWRFESSGHNVSCNPDHSEKVRLPDDAELFASYDGDDKYRADEVGSTFGHTFTTPGTYVYVCIPHETSGMVGEVVVEE